MYSRGVLVHCPCRLSAAVSVLAAEIPRGDGVFTKRALEHRKTVHRLDGVMSHFFNCIRLSRDESERKLPHITRWQSNVNKRQAHGPALVPGSYSIKYVLDLSMWLNIQMRKKRHGKADHLASVMAKGRRLHPNCSYLLGKLCRRICP